MSAHLKMVSKSSKYSSGHQTVQKRGLSYPMQSAPPPPAFSGLSGPAPGHRQTPDSAAMGMSSTQSHRRKTPGEAPSLSAASSQQLAELWGEKSQERNSLKRWGTKAIQGALCPLAGRQQANHPQRIPDPEGPGEEALTAKSDSPNVVGTKRDLQLPQYFG